MGARKIMCSMLEKMVQKDGLTPTSIDGVRLVRVTNSFPRSPMIYDPSIVIVLQGKKNGYSRDKVYSYDPDHYLVMSIPVPFECEGVIQTSEPYLAISINIDMIMLSNLLFEMGAYKEEADMKVCGIHAAPITEVMENAALRLLKVLETPADARILGAQIVREIVYYVLQGPQGAGLRAVAGGHSRFSQIARILRRMHADCTIEIDVESLAGELNMSVSSFHQNFKSVTSTSPIQYLKNVRLQQARTLMAHGGLSASAASAKVGYMSTSQFNREFKRLFGATPAEESSRMRKSLVGAA